MIKKAEERWGAGVVEQVSLDMRREFPDICSNLNKADVQWSFRGISTPMGVATYNNIRIADALPTQEQLKERMELLRHELQETKRLMNK